MNYLKIIIVNCLLSIAYCLLPTSSIAQPCVDSVTAHSGDINCDSSNSWCSCTDLDQDGVVSFLDVLIATANPDSCTALCTNLTCIVLADFGRTDCDAGNDWCNCHDLDQDGVVSFLDILIASVAIPEDTCANLCAALPIELLYFTGTPINNKHVLLEWSTLSEIDNDHFTIQRSINAENWEIIEVVQGAGNSSIQLYYSLVDEDPWSGVSYYRLKQVDFNGDYTYSNIVAVLLEGIEIINIYPNPAKEKINVIVVSAEDTEVDINVIDVIGRKIINMSADVLKGENNFELGVAHLSSAVYMLQVNVTSGKYRVQKEFIR